MSITMPRIRNPNWLANSHFADDSQRNSSILQVISKVHIVFDLDRCRKQRGLAPKFLRGQESNMDHTHIQQRPFLSCKTLV